MYKVAFFDTRPYDRQSFRPFLDGSGLEFTFFEAALTPDTALLAQEHDAVCIFVNDRADSAVLERLDSYGIRTVALRSAGFNNVDLVCARKHGFRVARVPAYSPYAVAEHTMALLLTSVRRIHKAYIRTRDFNFSLDGFTGFDLHGKTVGIIGTGRIGRAFIAICRGFGMRVLAYDKVPLPDSDFNYVDPDTLFSESDVLSLHCPLTPDTYHIINADTIEKCRKGVILLNTSRGALVDTDALLAGIKARKIGAACLDVYEEESNLFFRDFSGHILEDDKLARLISMPNVIVTAHQAFLTEEALAQIAETTVRNLRELLSGAPCVNRLC